VHITQNMYVDITPTDLFHAWLLL